MEQTGRMRKKAFNLCREFGCRRPTMSGKPERDVTKRTCVYHSVAAKKQRAEFESKAREAAKSRVSHVPKLRYLPLICMYKPYEAVRDPISGEILRVVYTAGICGAVAPRRRTAPRSHPRHPSRLGDPLCEHHAHTAQDELAFPGEPTAVWTDERREELQKRMSKIAEATP